MYQFDLIVLVIDICEYADDHVRYTRHFRQKKIFVGLILFLFSELKRERKKAEKKDNLKEVAQICNCIGELLAKYGMFNT